MNACRENVEDTWKIQTSFAVVDAELFTADA